jgi:hypothetical protein
MSAACALGVCCTATIATSSDGGVEGRSARGTGMVTVDLTSMFNSPAMANNDKAQGSSTPGTQHMTGALFDLHRHKYTYFETHNNKGVQTRL